MRSYRSQPTRLLCPRDSLGENTGVDCHALFQEIFPTQGSNLHPSPALTGVLCHQCHLQVVQIFMTILKPEGRIVYFVCTGANSSKPFEHILFPPALQSYDFSFFSDPPFHTFVPCLFFPILNHPPLLILKPFMINAIWLSPAPTFIIFQTPRPILLRELQGILVRKICQQYLENLVSYLCFAIYKMCEIIQNTSCLGISFLSIK